MTDYSKVVVSKPWGSEKIIYQSPDVEVWLLDIKKGQKTSLHSHPNKKTSLCVLSGAVKTSFLTGNPVTLLPSEKINIHPKVFHQNHGSYQREKHTDL
jgi:mannose-6-phosphate isomerase-like protein (cupin superfamily)